MSWPIGYLFRHVLESGYDYDTAINTFKTASLISPCYITVCTTDISNSCVIIRDPDSLVSIRSLNSTSMSVIQTNVDDGDNVKSGDNILYSRERCKKARAIITNDIPSCTDISDIFKAFDKHPITNDLTIYRVVMIPETNVFITRLC